ncbi:HET-domain-containing protein [Amniculicola lignicola CBS 123094]|uniref:HET-domain-containing protein n=1 Tax=Amniculicola lignicola CBS 123094 TaxID=1392246 RepID=A0A6A5WEK1_9PLEO|nr:HET-domain-containing protein [Amniculicola lignicola CBS 123094]
MDGGTLYTALLIFIVCARLAKTARIGTKEQVMPTTLYGPLDSSIRQIRVLEIAPSTDPTTPIECKLHVTSLDSDTFLEYTALSYVWGDPEHTTQIEVDGIHRQVTINLESALRHIRKHNEGVLLWADAICINQDDLEEREGQVAMMGSVFSTARGVIAWLGEESGDSHLAFQLIAECAEWIRGPSDYKFNFEPAEFMENVPHGVDKEAIVATQSLGSRPYWIRTWILQELVLAKKVDVLCGKLRLPFADFRLARRIWFAPGPSIFARSHAIIPALSLDLLLDLENLEATDPRDKIYGLLGILPPAKEQLLTPDYTKPAEDLFCEIAKEMLLRSGDLRVADCAATSYSTKDASRLPSWVPRWGTLHPRTSLSALMPWYRQDYASRFNGIRFGHNTHILYCKGKIIDNVKEKHDLRIGFLVTSATRGVVVMIEKIMESAPIGERSALQGLFRAFSLDTNIFDFKARRRLIPSGAEYYAQAAVFLKSMFQWLLLDPHLSDSSISSISLNDLIILFTKDTDDLHRGEELRLLAEALDNVTDTVTFEAALLVAMSRRHPFRTTSNRMGLGPEGMSYGDVVCHLVGHRFPFILHPEEDHYLVRGECYILGIELPEVTEELLSEMQEFEIR